MPFKPCRVDDQATIDCADYAVYSDVLLFFPHRYFRYLRNVAVGVIHVAGDTAAPGTIGRLRQWSLPSCLFGREFEHDLAHAGLRLLRPARKGEPAHPDQRFFKPLRQTIESIFDTAKGQLDLEAHGGHTITGVAVRVYQRLLALTATIWHNHHTGQPVTRSLLAYDH